MRDVFSVKKVLEADTDSHLWTFLCRLLLSLSLSVSHSGCSRLEVRGSGVGQDLPVGLPHSVNTGNCPNLHPCSADVLQHTLMNTHKLTNTLQQLVLVFRFVLSDCDLLMKLNKTFTLYISFVETSSSCKLLPPYSLVRSL